MCWVSPFPPSCLVLWFHHTRSVSLLSWRLQMALFIMWGLVHSASKHSTLLSAGHVSEPTGALSLELKDVQRSPQACHTDKHVTYDRNSATLLFPAYLCDLGLAVGRGGRGHSCLDPLSGAVQPCTLNEAGRRVCRRSLPR